jgi:hypothetical protein
MKATYAIRHEAFLKALEQLDLSTLPKDLQLEIDQVRQALMNEPTEAEIERLGKLVEKCDRLNQLYEAERLALKKLSQEQERSKGFPVTDDNPDPKDSGIGNFNPPSPEEDTLDSETPIATDTSNHPQPEVAAKIKQKKLTPK